MELLPDTRVLMMTASTEIDAVIEAVAAGATGYLQKYSQPEELTEAVLDVARGRIRMSEQALKEGFAMIRSGQWLSPRKASDELTAVERETLTLFAAGRSYAQIAEARGQQHRNGPEHPLPGTGKGGSQEQAGTGDLGCAERPAGRRGSGPLTPRKWRRRVDPHRMPRGTGKELRHCERRACPLR